MLETLLEELRTGYQENPKTFPVATENSLLILESVSKTLECASHEIAKGTGVQYFLKDYMCTQRRLRSACAFAHGALKIGKDPKHLRADSEDSDQIERMRWLICVR